MNRSHQGGSRHGVGRLVSGMLLLVTAGVGTWLVVVGLQPSGVQEAAPLPEPFVVTGSPTVPAEPAPDEGMKPGRLAIPSIDVDAPMSAGVVTSWSLDIPSDPSKLTLYRDGGQPCGTEGTVLVAGHVSSYGTHGALWPLSKIRPGATAHVSCDDGTITTWQVVVVQVAQKADLPQDVFNDGGEQRLVVVTCGGPVMPNGLYRDNVIAIFSRT